MNIGTENIITDSARAVYQQTSQALQATDSDDHRLALLRECERRLRELIIRDPGNDYVRRLLSNVTQSANEIV